MPRPRPTLAAAATLLLGIAAHATELNFDHYHAISPAAYGDRVTDFSLGYGNAGGATPNVVLDFVASRGAFSVYATGYAGLQSALGHSSYDVPGLIRLTPDAGFDVVLQGFDIAAWSSGSYPNSRIRVVDAAGTPLVDSGVFTFGPNAVQRLPAAPIRSSLGLEILVSDFGDLGVDNLVFGQAATVPDAPAAPMMLAGLGPLGAKRARKSAGAGHLPQRRQGAGQRQQRSSNPQASHPRSPGSAEPPRGAWAWVAASLPSASATPATRAAGCAWIEPPMGRSTLWACGEVRAGSV
ncbi:MAG: hypothetical protein JNL87_12310 [Burkholderiaceae bacterium]|nr:hypothetical protein [Burkholderiaceae bacterium]